MTQTSNSPAGASRSLAGRAVLITGGSRGLGAAIAEVLGRDGARVMLADLVEERGQAMVKALCGQGIEAAALGLDVGDPQQARQAVERTVACFGRLDVLVNNAAIDRTVALAELAEEDWSRIVQTNLKGPFLMSRHAVTAMRAQAGGTAADQSGVRGHIVNIASTADKRAWPNAAAYHATKWGLLGLSHALHAELRAEGILVSAIVAGGMRTPFLLDRFPDLDPGLLQEPANVAEAVRFVLCQPPGTVVPELMVLPLGETSWP